MIWGKQHWKFKDANHKYSEHTWDISKDGTHTWKISHKSSYLDTLLSFRCVQASYNISESRFPPQLGCCNMDQLGIKENVSIGFRFEILHFLCLSVTIHVGKLILSKMSEELHSQPFTFFSCIFFVCCSLSLLFSLPLWVCLPLILCLLFHIVCIWDTWQWEHTLCEQTQSLGIQRTLENAQRLHCSSSTIQWRLISLCGSNCWWLEWKKWQSVWFLWWPSPSYFLFPSVGLWAPVVQLRRWTGWR